MLNRSDEKLEERTSASGKIDNDKQEYPSVDILHLPPRNEVHTKKNDEKKKKPRQIKKNKTMMLVQILLVLFLFLVAVVATFPFWIQQLH